MKITTFCLLTLTLSLAACGQKEATEPEQAATGEAAAVEEAAAKEPMFNQAVIDHMHMHAEQLDNLMFALADDDLEGARTPAYWLSRHDTVEGLPEDLQMFVVDMREAAYDVEEAADLETARTAAEKISSECQGCHEAAGVSAFATE